MLLIKFLKLKFVGEKTKRKKIISALTHPPAPLWPIHWLRLHLKLPFDAFISRCDKRQKYEFGKNRTTLYKLCYLSSIYNFTRSPPSTCSHFVLYIVMVWKKMWEHSPAKLQIQRQKLLWQREKTRIYPIVCEKIYLLFGYKKLGITKII